jgi:citrate synthase
VYKAVDPRSVHLMADAKALGERKGQPEWFSILEAVTETKAMKQRAKKGIYPNVDFWAGAVYYLLDIPEDMFIPLFAMGRMPGWTAHIMEQYSKKDLLRPRLAYEGPLDLKYVPIEQRG